jgi:hypothetical protein
VAEFIAYLAPVLLALWTGWDARNRGANAFAWAVGVLLLALIVFPWYLTKRPLMTGEERRGGVYWNISKNLAILFTAMAPFMLVAVALNVASTASTVEDAAAEVIAVVLATGILWFILVGVVLVLGFILRKPWLIERGPSASLAQESGWHSAESRSVEQSEARTHSYSNNTGSLDNEEHHGNYGELASVKGLVDLSPQQALDEAQTFLVQQGYSAVQRRGESLTMRRGSPNQKVGQNTLNLTVTALHQPQGGVRIRVRGNDRQGVQERQTAWTQWAERLPKKQ